MAVDDNVFSSWVQTPQPGRALSSHQGYLLNQKIESIKNDIGKWQRCGLKPSKYNGVLAFKDLLDTKMVEIYLNATNVDNSSGSHTFFTLPHKSLYPETTRTIRGLVTFKFNDGRDNRVNFIDLKIRTDGRVMLDVAVGTIAMDFVFYGIYAI